MPTRTHSLALNSSLPLSFSRAAAKARSASVAPSYLQRKVNTLRLARKHASACDCTCCFETRNQLSFDERMWQSFQMQYYASLTYVGASLGPFRRSREPPYRQASFYPPDNRAPLPPQSNEVWKHNGLCVRLAQFVSETCPKLSASLLTFTLCANSTRKEGVYVCAYACWGGSHLCARTRVHSLPCALPLLAEAPSRRSHPSDHNTCTRFKSIQVNHK